MPETSVSQTDKKTAPLGQVRYPGLWKGITLLYTHTPGGIFESTYHIEPGADVSDIRLLYNVPVEKNEKGSLTMKFETGTMSESAPVAWQEINGKKVPVEVAFRRIAEQEAGFETGPYNKAYPLVIDPVLTWNTFMGGTGYDSAVSIAVDPSGNVYVGGNSNVSWGSPLRAHSGQGDVFIAKLDSRGAYLWHTFLGSSFYELLGDIAVDASGNVYATGRSRGTWGTPVNDYAGKADAFAAELDSAGAIVWNTFIGTSGAELGQGIAVDASGNVYVTGQGDTTWGSPVNAHSGGGDAFVVLMNGSGLPVWHTFMGSTGTDWGNDITVDASGNVYVAGKSDTAWGFPERSHRGGNDGFAAGLDSTGTLLWNTFMGSAGEDSANRIAVDASGDVYVVGTSDAEWGSPVNAHAGGNDAFVAKLDGGSQGEGLWHTFMGASGEDSGSDIALDAAGNIYAAGTSDAAWGGADSAYSGNGDAFAVLLDGGGGRLWHTFTGSAGNDTGRGLAVDDDMNVFIAGSSDTEWGSPVTGHTGGTDDGFAAKIAQIGSGDVKLLPTDGAAYDYFGKSVSISGNYAVVGAHLVDGNGIDSGAAYIFYHNGTSWSQQAKLTADDGAPADYFGSSVAISGDYALVGAYYDDDNGYDSGSAYIFHFDGTAWTQQTKLTADDGAAGDRFGFSVSISGDDALVGAYYDDDNGSNSGSAYIFHFDGAAWTQQAKLTADDAATDDWFGYSVSISGDYALVGAYQDDYNGSASGSAYIFHFDGTAWTQQTKLTADDAAADDRFGFSVSISGDDALVGAYQDDDNGSNSGSAYIFHRSGSTWAQQAKLTAADGAADDLFGISASLSGDDVLVGALLDDDNGNASGSAYIFHFDGAAWTQQAKLLPDDAAADDQFGSSVSISGDYALVGAHQDNDNGSDSGSAYIFEIGPPLVTAPPVHFTGDFGTSGGNGGIHAYNATDGFFQIATDDPSVLLAADTDTDGKDEIYAGFSTGFSAYTDGTWTRLTPAVAQNIIPFNGGMAIDFGTTGLWTYDGTGWTRITTSDASVMTAVNIDGSGDDELAVLFPSSSGVYLYNGAWTRLTTASVQNIAEYNGQLVTDFGTAGLYLRDSSSWTKISSNDAGLMHSGDMQGDSTPELTVHFPSGIFYYDGSAWSSAISTSAPENLITYNGKLYADFGSSGLHEYDGTSAWTQISTSDPVCLAVADTDNDSSLELAMGSALGIFTWNGSAWSSALTTYVPEVMVDVTQ